MVRFCKEVLNHSIREITVTGQFVEEYWRSPGSEGVGPMYMSWMRRKRVSMWSLGMSCEDKNFESWSALVNLTEW